MVNMVGNIFFDGFINYFICHLICIELRFLCPRLPALLGDLTRLVGERLSPPRPGMRLSMGDMGLVPRGGTERPRTGERLWFPGEASLPRLERDLVMSLPRSGRRRLGSGGGQEVKKVRMQDL